MKNLQQAADDAGVIAETVETLHKLLDKFYADHGEEVYGRLEAAWPDAPRIHGPRALYDLSRKLAPSDSDLWKTPMAEQVCTKDAPNKTLRVHPDAREGSDQRDGWPGGDTVTMVCPNCGVCWTKELAQ